jgi:hypothetical protein
MLNVNYSISHEHKVISIYVGVFTTFVIQRILKISNLLSMSVDLVSNLL